MDNEDLQEQEVSEHTGFPNAATDKTLSSLDLGKLLVQHPSSTFYMRVDGDTGQDAGIFAGDIIVIDRALAPEASDLVVWWENESFVISRPSKLPAGLTAWGTITHAIHTYRDKPTRKGKK